MLVCAVRVGVADVFVDPFDGFGLGVEDRFAGAVAVAFVREQGQADGAAVAFDGLIQA